MPRHNSTALSPRTDRESRDVATLFDIQPTFDESPYNEAPEPEAFPVSTHSHHGNHNNHGNQPLH